MVQYLINIDDGSISFRNKYTDRQINMKPISNEIVEMVADGRVKAADVVAAINAKIRESGEFDNIEKYLLERAKLNVHKVKYDLTEQKEELPDRSAEEISVGDVVPGGVSGKVKPKTEKVEKSEKPVERKAANALPFDI